jgi:hypothetical protein
MKPLTFTKYFKNTLQGICLLILLTACTTQTNQKNKSLASTQYIQDSQFPATNGFKFQNISWLTLTPLGDEIYFLQRGAPTVSVWSLDGSLLRSWDTQELGLPHSLSFQQLSDGSLRIWITDMAPPQTGGDGYGHCLKQFNINGDYLGSIGTCGIDSQGSDLNPVQFDRVTDIAFDAKGNLWVTDGDIDGLNNRVLQIEQSSGNVLQVWSAPQNKAGNGEKEFNLPHSIDIDTCDRVWVADTLNHRVQIIATDGTFLQELQCFGNDGVYGISVKESPSRGMLQLFTTSSPTSSPTGGTVRVFDVSSQCDAPLPVPNQCITENQWSITLPQGSSEGMLHMVDASIMGDAVYIAPLGGDLAPLKWIKVYPPAD